MKKKISIISAVIIIFAIYCGAYVHYRKNHDLVHRYTYSPTTHWIEYNFPEGPSFFMTGLAASSGDAGSAKFDDAIKQRLEYETKRQKRLLLIFKPLTVLESWYWTFRSWL